MSDTKCEYWIEMDAHLFNRQFDGGVLTPRKDPKSEPCFKCAWCARGFGEEQKNDGSNG